MHRISSSSCNAQGPECINEQDRGLYRNPICIQADNLFANAVNFIENDWGEQIKKLGPQKES